VAGSAPVGVIAVQVLPVVFALIIVGLFVWAGTWLGRYLMDATRTPDGDTVANRMLGHSPGDYAAEQEALAERRRLARPLRARLRARRAGLRAHPLRERRRARRADLRRDLLGSLSERQRLGLRDGESVPHGA